MFDVSIKFVSFYAEISAMINNKCKPLQLFNEYLKYSYYPFFIEGENDYYSRIDNIVNLIIDVELPMFCGVDIGNARKNIALLGIISSTVPFVVDISKLSTMTGIERFPY